MADQPDRETVPRVLPELEAYGPTLKPQEVARVLSLSTAQVQRHLAGGRLPGFKVAGQWRSRRSEIEEVLLGTWVPQPTKTTPTDVDQP